MRKSFNLLSVPFISLNFPPSSGTKKRFTWMAFWPFHQHLLSKTYLYVVTWLSPCEATRRTYASLRCVCTLHTYKRTVHTQARENSKCSCGQQCCSRSSLMHGALCQHSFTSFSDHFFVGVQEKEQKIVYLCIRHAILN